MVQSLLRESQVIRQTKEKEISELKKRSDQSTESLKNEWEKKEQVLHELETRVKLLSVEVQNGNLLQQKVTQEKAELEIHIASISGELQEANHKYRKTTLSVEKLRYNILPTLQAKLEKERADSKRKINKKKQERDVQLVHLQDSRRHQDQQAESAQESFKKQVELSSGKTYTDMKQQMEKVETDVIRSKSLREKQSKEFSYQLEELQRRYEQQSYSLLSNHIVELKLQHEQERTHLLQTHNAEKDSLVQDHQREIDSLDKQARATMVQHQTQTQEWRKRNAQTISDLEDQVHSLRKELWAAHIQRKELPTELCVLWEEERQQASQDKQAALDRLWAEMDQVWQDLERTHKAERELTQEKTNSRSKHLEKEYDQKLAMSAQVIAELQISLSSVKEDNRQTQQSLERQLQEAQSHCDEERRQLSRDADQTSKVLQEHVESLQRQLHAVKKKLMSRELEYQEQITHVRQDCESKIKGLIPTELQQELEDTITSLKSQVSFLQKRASVLQEQLDACHIRR
ncbi:centrosomal protein of 112 kDa-like [Carassius gibelio]|uniref:centrosomal protein of 112 kDa-like n=1 Tax=Carassius gibelio TaxID=101364 RepID=UPI0022796CC0|nr:centrosomal protein of 112 kDa-like [Carassius gibelio]